MSIYRIDVKFPPFVSDYKAAFEILENTPETGDQIPHTGSYIFKIRVGIKGQRIGRRGGFRLIYHVDSARQVITPLALYFKPDTPNLSNAEIEDRIGRFSEYVKEDPDSVSSDAPPLTPD